METKGKPETMRKVRLTDGLQQILFAQTGDPSITVGVVSNAAPSSLALLAAGVAGLEARRARRSARIQFLQTQKKAT
jgi:hypothetical protein